MENRYSQVTDDKIPTKFKELIKAVFMDVDFLPQALYELLASKLDDRVFKVLKTIDWKLSPSLSMNAQKFKQMAKRNVWEYRFSRAGRLLVEYREKEKPLVILIDPQHKTW